MTYMDETNTLGNRIRRERNARGLTLKNLAEKAHISISFLADIEKDRSQPSVETLSLIARALGVSIDYLVHGKDAIPVSDSAVIEKRNDKGEGTEIRAAGGRELIERIGAWPVGPTVKVPVLGVIRAGEPIYAEQNIEGWEEVPQEWVNGECFFLRVAGDSMVGARIQEGDLVFVRRQDFADNGDIVVAIVNGEDATIKRIFFADETIILHPENPKYRPLVFRGKERDEVRIVGKVLWFRGTVG